ncbi:MAG: CotH kinase family protein [Clostridia bacterium]|nr:CotH kinase family protein [Clostridia bacterium]
MRKTILGCIACVLALAITFITAAVRSDTNDRFHQHMDAEPKTACTHGDDRFCTHLPLVQIDTGGEDIPGVPIPDADGRQIGFTTTESGETELLCNIKITDNPSENNHIGDTPAVDSAARVRVHGNSSRFFDKHNYSVTFVTESGENNPLSVMGMDAHHEWVLHGPFLDKTLLRNYLCCNIAGEIMDWAPNVRFCEVILSGEYNGLYLMTESITAGQDGARLNMTVDKKDNSFSGYILRLDRGSANALKNIEPFSLYSDRIANGHINIVYPGAANLTEELRESIRQDFSDFEHMLYSFDFDHSEYGYSQAIDVDSFINYFLLNEFTCNYDAGTYSTYIYKGIDGKYRMCVWDFNNAFDNYQEQRTDAEMFTLQECLWYYMLIKDDDFTDTLIDRYYALRQTYFSEEYLDTYIDDTIAYLGDAIDRNFEKWGYTFESDEGLLSPHSRNPHSYAEAVEQLKAFIAKRGGWMDENIEALRQYSANSKTKLYKEHTK